MNPQERLEYIIDTGLRELETRYNAPDEARLEREHANDISMFTRALARKIHSRDFEAVDYMARTVYCIARDTALAFGATVFLQENNISRRAFQLAYEATKHWTPRNGELFLKAMNNALLEDRDDIKRLIAAEAAAWADKIRKAAMPRP